MGVGSVLLAVGKSPFQVVIFLASKIGWFGLITMILVGLTFVTAGIESYQTHSPVPLVRDVGGKIVDADSRIFQNTQIALEKNSSDAIERLKDFGFIFFDLWFIFVNYRIFMWIINKVGSKDTPYFPQKFFQAVFAMWIAQVFYSLLFLHMTFSFETLYLFVPFRGVILFLSNIGYFFAGLHPIIIGVEGKTLGQNIMGLFGWH